ncbi:class II aldolase/adducin family protein [Dorea sp. D27]|uniref:class II aldolase/adducin family protein n=1 Tax=Dorea sp. D27 TaxID=658665 RepID=UPI0006737658|nr:class II aldolase/adducin family protein [Dorea sp. D27]KMZ54372.1 L-fuculose phosphate aldolase [Dorea sp. D27]
MCKTEMQQKEEIVEAGKSLYDKGLLVGTDGNISIRLSEQEVLITASGFCKGRLTAEQITKVDMEGHVLEGLKPARDIRMHLAVYRECREAKAVVHAHPPVTTGYAMSEVSFEKTALPEVLFALKGIAVTEYTTPTTVEVPLEVSRVMAEDPECRTILLANHGALTIGSDVGEAFYMMETLEMFLKANLVSKLLGNTRYLDEVQMEKVNRLIKGEDPDSVIGGTK